MSRTKALLHCIGMVEDDYAVGEAEYEEMARKHETGKKIKAMAKTLGKILAVSWKELMATSWSRMTSAMRLRATRLLRITSRLVQAGVCHGHLLACCSQSVL